MLQRLSDWRAQYTDSELAAFERELLQLCGRVTNTSKVLRAHYQDSYHMALINSKILTAAMQTNDLILGLHPWERSVDAGARFCRLLADQGGVMDIRQADAKFNQSIGMLLQRGVLFEHHGNYCLPIELVLELRGKEYANSWITLVAQIPVAMLYQLIPDEAQAAMRKPKALRSQLASWLVLEGQKAWQGKISEMLEEADWTILLSARLQHIDTLESLNHFFPDLDVVRIDRGFYYHESKKISLRKTLEKSIPDRLQKLCRLGLVGIQVERSNDFHAAIVLCDEAREVLKPHFKQVRERLAASIQQQWQSTPCEVEVPSPWSMDQHIWQLWIALHFLPQGVTQQGQLRKNDIKKISKFVGIADATLIGFLVISMLYAGLLTEQNNRLRPAAVKWSAWAKKMRTSLCDCLRQGYRWSSRDERTVCSLLAQLPVERWLKLSDVVTWLQMQTDGKLRSVNWQSLFTKHQHYALHHLNQRQGCIYLLPIFHAVMRQQPVSFPAPGWHGAGPKAKVHGFISAAGEIQLPPDCNHRVLGKLSEFCTLTSVEQMITLQLDNKALQRMGTDKSALKRTQRVLESLRSPLPQAVAYLFDKQQAQKPVAVAAAASMVMVLYETSAIHKLRKLSFTFSQPFKDKPEIVLLDASADAHDFIQHCAEAGVMLDTLIKPIQWISGTASVRVWMDNSVNSKSRWLEICYQKQSNSKPKQLIARTEYNHFGEFVIKAVRKGRQGYALLKSTVLLQPKHVLRLRELDESEVQELGLDRLA